MFIDKSNKKLFTLVILFIILVIFTFYPNMKREVVLEILNSNQNITNQHINNKITDSDLHILPVPFGKLIFTYEGMWYITFLGKVI